MQRLEVGKLFKDGVTKYQETCKFDMTDSGGNLIIFYNSPTMDEIEDISKGKAQYGYYKESNIIFMLFKFGSQEWMDCPYSVHLSKNLTELQEASEGLGYAVNIYLVDASTGILKVARLIGMNTRMSKMLKKDLIKQKLLSFENYQDNLTSIYNKLSTREMVKRADCTGKVE